MNNIHDENKITNAIALIEKEFGKGAVLSLGDYNKIHNIDIIPTGALALDIALGTMGIPRGRIIELFGPESSGKTTLATHIAINAQKTSSGIILYIDAEHSFDPTYASALGLDMDRVLISQPQSGEEALNIANVLAQTGDVCLIVIDSVAALVPKAELDGEVGDAFVGLQARMMSQALRKISASLSKTNTSAIFINQIRDKINTGGLSFGNNETTPGGRALKFYASVRLDIRRIGSIKSSDNQDIGNKTRVKIVKNKVAAPFKTAEFDIMFGEGISYESSLIDMALDLRILDKKGTWIYYNKEQLGQGKENVRILLKSKLELKAHIESDVMNSVKQPEATKQVSALT